MRVIARRGKHAKFGYGSASVTSSAPSSGFKSSSLRTCSLPPIQLRRMSKWIGRMSKMQIALHFLTSHPAAHTAIGQLPPERLVEI